jgi:hypothetical protein
LVALFACWLSRNSAANSGFGEFARLPDDRPLQLLVCELLKGARAPSLDASHVEPLDFTAPYLRLDGGFDIALSLGHFAQKLQLLHVLFERQRCLKLGLLMKLSDSLLDVRVLE